MNRDVPVSRRYSFGRGQRLIRPAQFKRVFQHNRRSGDAYFTVLGHNTQQQAARLGLAISRKVIKRAVGRNRIKRLIRESFRRHQAELAGWDIVVLVRKDATQLSNARIYETLKKHWYALSAQNETTS